jgi:hypothetical protein
VVVVRGEAAPVGERRDERGVPDDLRERVVLTAR